MTSINLKSNGNDEISKIMNRQFFPRLNKEDDSNYYPLNVSNNINSIYNEKNTFNKLCFLFPSIPREVSLY